MEMKYDFDEFAKALKEKYPNDIFELVEFDDVSRPGVFWCGRCKKNQHIERMNKLLNVARKHICTECFGTKNKQDSENVLMLIEQFPWFTFKKFVDGKFVVYKCEKCGRTTKKTLKDFLKQPFCSNKKCDTPHSINCLLPQGYEIVNKYKSQVQRCLVRHECGFIFSARPSDFQKKGTHCPKCFRSPSKGVKKMIDFFDSHNISYIHTTDQREKDGFDFFLPDYNLLINYLGLHHFEEVPKSGHSLEKQQRIDAELREEAKSRQSDYLEISYKDFDSIEDILAQRLNVKNS